jgi:hypothetical protein
MSIARHHAEWLSLVEQSGPFLSMPVLLRVLPQGLDAHDPDHLRQLKLAHQEWEENRGNPAVHRAWVRFVLTQTLEMPADVLAEGQTVANLKHEVQEHGETLRPDYAIMHGGKPHLLVQVYPARQDLERPLTDRHWKATCGTRMMELLHATGVRLGLLTNGEHWMLVDAPRGDTTGFASWYATFWQEEHLTLRAFRTLLSARRFFSVPDNETLAAMLKDSADNQADVTNQLGYQVRKAVEVLIHSLDRADLDHGRKLLGKVPEAELYEAALTVMMRLVFLFSAEERGLLLLGDPLYDQHYAVSTLRERLREDADQHGEEVVERRLDAWVRLLATFRAVHGGATHHRLTLPAYGGNLFDPDRFPFLEGRTRDTSYRDTPATPLPVNNRTVLHLLEALQLLQVRVPGGGPAEARRLSFRALDIEQIGHVYEGLLDHTAKRAAEPMLGLIGTKDKEPEIALAVLEKEQVRGEDSFLAFLKELTGRSETALGKALDVTVEGLDAGRFRGACGNDAALWQRVEPFAGLLRDDTFGYPVVIPPGSVYVTEGVARRTSGTHYTPRELTVPIVRYTLEPLVYDGPAEGQPPAEWRLHSARDLLSLKVCDMATGSGAFIVQACRYLAERLLEAWDEVEHAGTGRQASLEFDNPDAATSKGVPRITPFGDIARGRLDEQIIPDEGADRTVYALRLVAQRCLYGVDKNPMAVEMAKLSLWLLTLAKGQPFTFLDHAIRCGDSLVGIYDLEQLRNLSLAGDTQIAPAYLASLDQAVKEATACRQELETLQIRDVEDVHRQEQLFHKAEALTAKLRAVGDLLIADAFADEQEHVVTVLAKFRDSTADQLQKLADQHKPIATPFHWPLEFPEVFSRSKGGFDALVGNPPFMGGQKITGTLGDEYREYLVRWLANGQRGSADICAYFFLRGEQLLGQRGQLGSLATNTIAQGDTREVGLDQLLNGSCVIPRAVRSRPWPGTASLEIALVWVRRGTWASLFVLDEEPVSGITAFLTPPGAVSGKPYRLKANEGKSFIGSYVLGMGFVLTPEEAQRLIDKNPKNKDVLFPYLNGKDLNSRPDQSPSRWVINFFDWPIERAREYPDCFRIVEEKVKPERAKLIGRNPIGTKRGQNWWKYGADAKELYRAIAGMEWVLTLSLVNNHLGVGVVPTGTVFAHKLAVFACAEWDFFCVLQSHLHYHWAWHYCSTMRTDINYSPSDCFETFPFPCKVTGLDTIGERYHEHRRQIMLARQEGLTKTYNRFHDREDASADIQKLRQMHVEMDQAVAAAYGWTDLDLGHDFTLTKQGLRYTISELARREVLARLLKLNHERYAEEVEQGFHDGKSKKKSASAPTTRKPSRKKDDEPTLFDPPVEEEDDATEGPASRPQPLEVIDTDEVMAAFRQAARGVGWQERDELLKAVSQLLGYQRVGPKIRESLKGHLRAAIRRKIIEADGEQVRACAATMDQYDLAELRDTLCSVMRTGRGYEREEVIHAVARYLGFVRVTETVLAPIKSAINSGIRQGVLAYEGDRIWRA